MVGIYSIINKVNGKRYIGQSANIKERWRQHRGSYNSLDSYDYTLYKAIRKYGLDNFEFEVIKECRKDDLDKLEIFYIEKYNTYRGEGYNMTPGGDGGGSQFTHYSEEVLNEITQRLIEGELNNIELSKMYGVSDRTISRINNGHIYKRELDYPLRKVGNHCDSCGRRIQSKSTKCTECQNIAMRQVERPSKEKLLKDVALNGYSATGRKYGVADTTIRQWIKKYGYPTPIKEVKELYKQTIK